MRAGVLRHLGLGRVVGPLGIAGLALDPQHDEPAQRQGDGEYARMMEQRLDVADPQGADHGGRHERDRQVPHKAALLRIAGEEAAQHLQDARAKHPHHRQDGAELDDDLEHLVVAR